MSQRQLLIPHDKWDALTEALLDRAIGHKTLVTVRRDRSKRSGEFRLVWVHGEDAADLCPDCLKKQQDRLAQIAETDDELAAVDWWVYTEKPDPKAQQECLNREIGKPRQEDYAAFYPIVLVHRTTPTAIAVEAPVNEELVATYADTHGSGTIDDYDLDPPDLLGTS